MGRQRVCAGCTYAFAGAMLGGLAGAVCAWGDWLGSWAVGWQLLGACAFLLSVDWHAQKAKWLLRGGPLFCIAGGLVAALPALAAFAQHPQGHGWLGIGELAWLGLVARAAWRYRRRAPWRAPCVTCPQRTSAVCDGWQRMVQRERALHRLSGQWLAQRPTRHHGR